MCPALVYWLILIALVALGALSVNEGSGGPATAPSSGGPPTRPLTPEERARLVARLAYLLQVVVTQTTQGAVLDAKLIGVLVTVLVVWVALGSPLYRDVAHQWTWDWCAFSCLVRVIHVS
jgi:hypothetical protein